MVIHRKAYSDTLPDSQTAMESQMGYAELIEKMQNLPSEKKSEVLDFVEFLASRTRPPAAEESAQPKSALSEWRAHPFSVPDFSPMSREETNIR